MLVLPLRVAGTALAASMVLVAGLVTVATTPPSSESRVLLAGDPFSKALKEQRKAEEKAAKKDPIVQSVANRRQAKKAPKIKDGDNCPKGFVDVPTSPDGTTGECVPKEDTKQGEKVKPLFA